MWGSIKLFTNTFILPKCNYCKKKIPWEEGISKNGKSYHKKCWKEKRGF